MVSAITTLLLYAANSGSEWSRLRPSPLAIRKSCATARGSMSFFLLLCIDGLLGTSGVVVAEDTGQPLEQRVCVAMRVQA